MRKFLTAAVAVALVSATSYADLQNMTVGGSIRIRANSFFADDAGNSQFTEQRTTLKWSADFTDEVSTVIELDSYGNWGTEFRDTLSGPGMVQDGTELNVYQAYIELGEAWGTAFDIKIGRQEVQLGSEFLIGNNDTAGFYTGLSFDGVVATYNADTYNVTLLSLKVVEADTPFVLTDADTDLYGIYGTYTGREDMVIDGYLLYTRMGVPGADNMELYTIGARIDGTFNQFDYEAELAIQTGDTSTTADFDGLAFNGELGYTFDTDLAPRVWVGGAFFEGSDSSDLGFNRLFSDWEYSEFLSNGDLTNALVLRLGASVQATEKIGLAAVGAHFEVDEEDIGGLSAADYGGAGDDDIGDEIGLYLTYQYSEDVAMELGYAHFFVGDEDVIGTDDDPDYFYAEISINF